MPLVKPPPGLPLRADAPFASDLLDFWALREPSTQQVYRSLGKARSVLTLSNSSFAAIQSGPIGPEYRLDTGSSGYAATTTTLPITAPPFTLFLAARITGINGGGRNVFGLADAGVGNFWAITAYGYNVNSDNRFAIRLGSTFTSGTNLGTAGSNVHGVVLRVPAVGGNAVLWGDGSLWATSSNTVPSFTAARLCLGNYTDYAGAVGVQCAGIIGRLLSDAEASNLSILLQQDPHYLVRPRRTVAWIAASTLGGGTTPISDTDSASLAEAASLAAALSGTDAATESESATLAATLAGTESGALGESIGLAASLATTDAASLADAGSVDSFTGAVGTDSGTLSESGAIAVSLAATELLTFTESASVAVVLAGSDTGTLAESASVGGQRLYPSRFRVSVIVQPGKIDPSKTTVDDL